MTSSIDIDLRSLRQRRFAYVLSYSRCSAEFLHHYSTQNVLHSVSDTEKIRTGRVRGLNDEQFARRSYWKYEENVKHIILVHYYREDPIDVEVGPGDDQPPVIPGGILDPNDVEVGPSDDQLPVTPEVILDPDSDTDEGSSNDTEEPATNFLENLAAELLQGAEIEEVEELAGVQLLYSKPSDDLEEALTSINARKNEASVKRKREDQPPEDLATLEAKERAKEPEGLATLEERQLAKEPEDLPNLEETDRAKKPEDLGTLEETEGAREPEGLATLEERGRGGV